MFILIFNATLNKNFSKNMARKGKSCRSLFYNDNFFKFQFTLINFNVKVNY